MTSSPRPGPPAPPPPAPAATPRRPQGRARRAPASRRWARATSSGHPRIPRARTRRPRGSRRERDSGSSHFSWPRTRRIPSWCLCRAVAARLAFEENQLGGGDIRNGGSPQGGTRGPPRRDVLAREAPIQRSASGRVLISVMSRGVRTRTPPATYRNLRNTTPDTPSSVTGSAPPRPPASDRSARPRRTPR